MRSAGLGVKGDKAAVPGKQWCRDAPETTAVALSRLFVLAGSISRRRAVELMRSRQANTNICVLGGGADGAVGTSVRGKRPASRDMGLICPKITDEI